MRHFVKLTQNQMQMLVDGVAFTDKSSGSEQDHQKKISDDLIAQGFEVTKVVVATRSGESDLFATSPIGQSWYIEVKRPGQPLPPLQRAKLVAKYNNKAVVMVAYGYKDYKEKMKAIRGTVERGRIEK